MKDRMMMMMMILVIDSVKYDSHHTQGICV